MAPNALNTAAAPLDHETEPELVPTPARPRAAKRLHSSAKAAGPGARPLLKIGMKLHELEVLTGLDAHYLTRVVHGKFAPRLDKAQVIAVALQMPLHDLAYKLGLVSHPRPFRAHSIPNPEDINRSEVARCTGMDLGYVSRIVRGIRQPSLHELGRLAEHFETSIDVVVWTFKL